MEENTTDIQSLKQEAQVWLDEHGKDASDDMLIVSILWTAFTFTFNLLDIYFISAALYWKIISFTIIIAYIFLALSDKRVEGDI